MSLGVRYVQNHYPKEQNEGFYPLKETWTVEAYSDNVMDKSVASYTTIFLQKAFQRENDAYKFSTDNHPNPFNKMNSNKPIKIGNISVTYGDKIPFIINGTSAEIIEQELRIQLLIVNKNGENVYDQEYVIIQNQ
ncbi:MAG: hypothetical protein ACC656_05065, partial [Candidatus Heimdallarchaeota archaeon]